MGELNSQLGRLVYLDTNIIIYAVEGYRNSRCPDQVCPSRNDGRRDHCRDERSDSGGSPREAKARYQSELEEAYRQFLLPTESFRNSAVSREILEAAADIAPIAP
jgi:hypothetical protein